MKYETKNINKNDTAVPIAVCLGLLEPPRLCNWVYIQPLAPAENIKATINGPMPK